MFNSLMIRKNEDSIFKGYLNLCLVLDDEEQDKLCTDAEYGFKIPGTTIRATQENRSGLKQQYSL